MTNYKEILRLHSLGINNTRIAESCGCARSTVIAALQRAAEQELSWNKIKNCSAEEVARKLYTSTALGQQYKMPDYEWVHREMQKSGVMVVYYTTLSHLITDLKKAQLQGRLERRWRVYLRPAVLVIDEVGYMQLDRQEAELLFRLISERYEHGSIILTSNKYFSDWGELLSDNILATALLDRLLHHAHVVNIRGQTYRLRERWKAGVQPVPPAELPADN